MPIPQSQKFYNFDSFPSKSEKNEVAFEMITGIINNFFEIDNGYKNLSQEEKKLLSRILTEPNFVVDIIPILKECEYWEVATECSILIKHFCIPGYIDNYPILNNSLTIKSLYDPLAITRKDYYNQLDSKYKNLIMTIAHLAHNISKLF